MEDSEVFFDGSGKTTPFSAGYREENIGGIMDKEDTNILNLDESQNINVDAAYLIEGDDEVLAENILASSLSQTGQRQSPVFSGGRPNTDSRLNIRRPNSGSVNSLLSDDAGSELQVEADVLDEDLIENGLTNLARSADGTQQVYLHLSLPGYGLKDISLLDEYVHLQKVEIPYNEITDLSPLGNMPHLLHLDAAHNKVTTLLDFIPPKNLHIVDLSFNCILNMTDLSAHHYLTKLILDNNDISELTGLDNCHRLSHLSLAHNLLSQIQGLDNLPIEYLNLSNNHIVTIENLDSLRLLQNINLSGNQIRSMNGLEDHEFLSTINLEGNEVIDMAEVQHIRGLGLLRDLNLHRNPLRELPDYRLSIIYCLPHLTELDKHRVEVEEKVAAGNMFSPQMEVVAARDHVMHVVYSFLQPSHLNDSTLPNPETPYPMLVLVGPQGTGKKDLALKLVEEFPDYFGYGTSHTTRKPTQEEKRDREYHFVSVEDFENNIKMGQFLQTSAHGGHLYGLSLESVEGVARDGLACVVPMELEGVLTLKNTYFEPRYVLMLPMNAEAHERRLRERNTYTEFEIKLAMERVEVYAEHNRNNAGFFDMMINCDDLTEAYRKLRRLVMDYLGITGTSPSQSDLEPGLTELSFLEREATMGDGGTTTAGNSAHLARTWSKHSLAESLNQALMNIKNKAQSPMPQTGRGIVEEEAMKRRHSAAKEMVSGHTPSIYSQISKTPRTVPQTASSTMENNQRTSWRSYSAPTSNMDALPPCSPDSSQSDADSSGLSNISEAQDMAERTADSLDGSLQGSHNNLVLPTEALDRIELLSGSASKNLSSTHSVPLAPRPNSGGQRPMSGMGSRSGSAMSQMSNRPGSDRHPILPPINGQHEVPVSGLPDY